MNATARTDSAPAHDTAASRLERVVLGLVAVALLVFTKDGAGSWADASRLATIQSLAEHGTLAIDESDYVWQGDKVRFDGRFYSHQPPMLALIGAAVDAPLHHVFGLEIQSPWTYRILTLVLVGLPVWLGLLALRRLLADYDVRPNARAVLLALTFFATLLLPYSLVLNQHGTAAGLVLIAWLAVDRRRFAAAGVLLALAATIDLTAAFPAAAACVPVLLGGRARGLLLYVLGALPPLALHFSINVAVAGDLLPFGMHAEAFQYAMSPFMLMSLTGVDAVDAPGVQTAYLRAALIGSSGLFSHHPILLFHVAAGLALAVFALRRAQLGPTRGLLLASALSAIGIAVYYLTSSRNLGGSSFGIRWFTVFVPLMTLWSGAWLGAKQRATPDFRLPGVALAAVAALGLWSTATAALGAVNPWTKFHYTFEQSPRGMVWRAGDPRPTSWREHLLAEWDRIQIRPPVSRAYYDQTFARMLDQLRRMYLRPEGSVTPEQRIEFARQGIEKLAPVVDLMDSEAVPFSSRPQGHFWLGKLYLASGERERSKREFELALTLDPEWTAPEHALRQFESE